MHSFDQERKCCFEPATFFKMSLKMVDHRQNRKRSRHDNDDIDLTPDGDDGPPLKRIKLNPDDEDTCQELKLLSQTMNTIYNRSQHSSDPTFKFEDDLYKIQINEIIDALFLTHIMDLRYFTHADHRISSPFKKLLREFYGMHTVQFVEKWYTEQNIYSLYNGWKQYNVSISYATFISPKTHIRRANEPSSKSTVFSTNIKRDTRRYLCFSALCLS
eukprot:931409_1